MMVVVVVVVVEAGNGGGFMCGGTLRGLAEVGGELGEPPTKMVSALPNTRP